MKIPSKTQNCFIVGSFLLAFLECLVRGKCLTAQMWAYYINRNHPITYASLVDAVMLHHYVSTNNETKTTYL